MLMKKLTGVQEELLKRFVTDVYGPVYFIHSLPEFLIPPINSKVSRRDTSWRLNILESLTDGDLDISEFLEPNHPISYKIAIEKAKAFHEKWVEKFGHSSIAEQDLMHLCIEDASRYLSGDIELMNKRPSYIEWSQRYQKPTRDKIVIPEELKEYPDLLDEFIRVWNISFDTYEELVKKLTLYLSKTINQNDNESDKHYFNRISKIAFEDARYVLLLSTKTSFTVALNALDMQDIVRKLFSHDTIEAKKLAEKIIHEAEKIAPSMLRHTRPTPYQEMVSKRIENGANKYLKGNSIPKDDVTLVYYTGEDSNITLLDNLIKHILFSYSGKPLSIIDKTMEHLSYEDKNSILNNAIKDIGQFDHLIEAFRTIRYEFQVLLSEASWHQLLRHRMINFNVFKPTIEYGYIVPPNIEKAGCIKLFNNAIKASENLYNELYSKLPNACPYVVTNAHKRLILMDTDLWAFDHFANLRCTEEAQWDIRSISFKMLEMVKGITPEFGTFLARRKMS